MSDTVLGALLSQSGGKRHNMVHSTVLRDVTQCACLDMRSCTVRNADHSTRDTTPATHWMRCGHPQRLTHTGETGQNVRFFLTTNLHIVPVHVEVGLGLSRLR